MEDGKNAGAREAEALGREGLHAAAVNAQQMLHQPRACNIQEAEGGYIFNSWIDNRATVCPDLDALLVKVSQHFS